MSRTCREGRSKGERGLESEAIGREEMRAEEFLILYVTVSRHLEACRKADTLSPQATAPQRHSQWGAGSVLPTSIIFFEDRRTM